MDLALRLDDEATSALPDPLTSGRFRPTNLDGGDGNDPFLPTAPAPSGSVALSSFNGIKPNGTWRLFVYDDNNYDTGAIAGGWSLEITAKSKKRKR